MTSTSFREKVFQLTVNAVSDQGLNMKDLELNVHLKQLKNGGLMMDEAAELRSCINGYHPQSPGAQLDLFAASLLGRNLTQVPIVSALKYVANGFRDRIIRAHHRIM